MKRKHIVSITAVVAIATGACIGLVGAAGAPPTEPLVYQGQLTDAKGSPVGSSTQVQVALFKSATPGADVAVCQSPVGKTEAGTGHFSLPLGASCAKAVRDNPTLYVEVIVGSTTKTSLPRTKLAAVPYALEADHAKSASSASGGLKAELDALKDSGLNISTLELNTTTKGPASGAISTAGGTVTVFGTLRLTGQGETEAYLDVDGKNVAKVVNLNASTGITAVVKGLSAGSHTVAIKSKSPGVVLYGSLVAFEAK